MGGGSDEGCQSVRVALIAESEAIEGVKMEGYVRTRLI